MTASKVDRSSAGLGKRFNAGSPTNVRVGAGVPQSHSRMIETGVRNLTPRPQKRLAAGTVSSRLCRTFCGVRARCRTRAASGRLLLLQRIGIAGIERADFLVPEAALVDLDAGPEQERLGQLLHGETDGVGGAVEPAVFDLARDLAVARGKQLGRRGVIEFLHPELQHRHNHPGMNEPPVYGGEMGRLKGQDYSTSWRG